MNLRDLISIVTRKKNRISFLPNFFKYLSSFSFSTSLSPPVVHSTHCLHFSFFSFLQHLLSRPTFMKIVFLLFLTCVCGIFLMIEDNYKIKQLKIAFPNISVFKTVVGEVENKTVFFKLRLKKTNIIKIPCFKDTSKHDWSGSFGTSKDKNLSSSHAFSNKHLELFCMSEYTVIHLQYEM